MSLSVTSSSAYNPTQAISGLRTSRQSVQPERPVGAAPAESAGNLVNAIASALQNLASTSASSSTADSGTSSTSDSSSSASNTTDSSSAAQALGTFLQNLMSALQQQSPQANGNPPPPPPPPSQTGSIDDQGPIAKDLQKLIASLSSDSSSSTSTTSSDSSATSSVNSTKLQSSFEQLLSALNINKSSGNSQLQSFLQDVMTQVSGRGAQGNWINTSA